MQIHLNADLAPYHTFAIHQRCQVLVEVETLEQLTEVYRNPEWHGLPKRVLGKGSNVLFTEYFAGVVIINRLKGITHTESPHEVLLHVMGGEDWPELVAHSVAQQWPGLENLALIPGCAGSAPIQNIGAYGVEFKDICAYVEYLDLTTMSVVRLGKEACEFGYRDSIFKHQLAENAVIIAVGLTLAKTWQPKLDYGPLKQLPPSCSPKQIYDRVCQIRQEKLPDPQFIGNAGSFFKNPVITLSHYQELVAQFPSLVAYPAPEGMKVAAGWLIDHCGLKGKQIGQAQVHPLQALVLTNIGGASVTEVLNLARLVVATVAEKYQIHLEHEVRFLGRTQETTLAQLEEGL